MCLLATPLVPRNKVCLASSRIDPVRRRPDGAGSPSIGWHGISVLQRLPFSGCLIPHFSPDWVTFRSIDDNSAMTSSSPANVPSTEAEGAEPSRSVPALNGDSEPLPFLGKGTGEDRSFAIDPKEMSQIVIQDVWPPRDSSENLEDPRLL